MSICRAPAISVRSGDGGIDAIYIQAKRWNDETVGVSVAQVYEVKRVDSDYSPRASECWNSRKNLALDSVTKFCDILSA